MIAPVRIFSRALCAASCAATLFSAADSHAEDGYDLWLRYGKVEDPARLQQYAQQASEIVLQGTSPTSKVARDELKTGLSGLLGTAIPLAGSVTRNGSILVGTPANSPLIASINLGDFKRLGNDGYVIRSGQIGAKFVTVIAANTDQGAMYGAFHFLRLIQTRQPIANLNLQDAPKLQRRILDHWDNLDGTIERDFPGAGKSIWKWNELPSKVDPRYTDYARANASIGINGAVLNNVNAKPEQLNAGNLRKAAAIADALRPYGVRVYLAVNFASPKKIGGLKTADPLDPAVREWWKDKADEIYKLIPDFGGFLIKANSEGQPGPQDYKRTHTDGANMLGEALAPHGGIVMWRAFVYNSQHVDPDRSKRAYLEFVPFDGKFAPNVFVQPKNGPVDFQPREPFHPLFGAMPKTSLMPELEIAQENMGHSTHLVYLAPMWKEFFESDTSGKGDTVAKVIQNSRMSGIAGVANVGTDRNWCGHDFAQANWYAFGRLAWNPELSSDQIADDWIRMTWGDDPQVVKTISAMMKGSWEACVNYEMPIGLHHLMEAGSHYIPKPETVNKGAPEYSATYYHKAGRDGIGFDRTSKGSDAVSQYAPAIREKFENLATCPDELILWFHHVSWDYQLKSGRTVWDELAFRYNDGIDSVKKMQAEWDSLQGKIDPQRFEAVKKKLAQHLIDATVWRDVCMKYFQSKSGKPLPDYLKP